MNIARGVLLWLVAGAVSGACDTLYGFDSPRPALGTNDTFSVDPLCTDLPIDPNALASVPAIITLTGKRENTGLGAESVPVYVQIGRCGCLEGECDSAENGGASSGGAGQDEDGFGPSCVGNAPPLGDLDAAEFELTAEDGRGCKQRSPSRLDCNLDASGEAAFGVVSRLRDAFNLRGFLPICVTPLELPGKTDHRKQLAVSPRVGTARVALAIAQIDGEAPAPTVPRGATCENVLVCEASRWRARFQAGVISSHLVGTTITEGNFEPTFRDVVLSATVDHVTPPASGELPFLSTSSSCESPSDDTSGPNGGAGGAPADEGLSLRIGARERSTDTFYLCAPGFASQTEVTIGIVDGGTDAPFSASRLVTAPALVESYEVERVESDWVLVARECGGERRPVAPSTVQIRPPLQVSPDGERVVIDCDGAEIDDAGAAGAGAGGAASAAPNACDEAIPLELGPEGTCSLRVPN